VCAASRRVVNQRTLQCRRRSATGGRNSLIAISVVQSWSAEPIVRREGFPNERFANFCWNNGIVDVEKRAKLAFACLLTAVGVR